MKKNYYIITIAFIISIPISFILGTMWQKFIYNDICLDMGGGKNPGNHPICIIEK